MGDEVYRLEPQEIADLVQRGELSAKEVLEVFLERIEGFNPTINAFVYIDVDRARYEAAEVDKVVASGGNAGLLAGVPIGVKDLEDVAGMPTTHGSVVHKDNIAKSDSIMVSRLRRAGCVVIGKTAAPEFGAATFTSTRLHGTTRNPWNLERTPGGSSGGSAAAVAAAMVPIATASDGGGSIRIPASYSGLFGPKGTFGRVPRGRSPESSYTSVHGPIARSVAAAARYFDCVMGYDEVDQFSLPHPGISYERAISEGWDRPTAVWSADLGFLPCAEEVRSIAEQAAGKAAAQGLFDLQEGSVELKESSKAWRLLGAAETWLRHESYWPEREEDLNPLLGLNMRLISETKVPDLAPAHRRRWENNVILAEVFEQVDLIITPTTSTTAFAAEGPMPHEIDGRKIRAMHSFGFTYPFNVSGHPAVSIPCGYDSDGMPVGLQLVGRRHEDHKLLAIAAQIERANPWPRIAAAYA